MYNSMSSVSKFFVLLAMGIVDNEYMNEYCTVSLSHKGLQIALTILDT